MKLFIASFELDYGRTEINKINGFNVRKKHNEIELNVDEYIRNAIYTYFGSMPEKLTSIDDFINNINNEFYPTKHYVAWVTYGDDKYEIS